MSRIFGKQIHAGSDDMDANGHRANTGFLDAVADSRMMYVAENGFPLWIR
jgi:hypothetical protein